MKNCNCLARSYANENVYRIDRRMGLYILHNAQGVDFSQQRVQMHGAKNGICFTSIGAPDCCCCCWGMKNIFFPLSLSASDCKRRCLNQTACPAAAEKKEIFSLLLRSLSSFNIAWESYFFLPKGNTYKFLLFINVWPHTKVRLFSLYARELFAAAATTPHTHSSPLPCAIGGRLINYQLCCRASAFAKTPNTFSTGHLLQNLCNYTRAHTHTLEWTFAFLSCFLYSSMRRESQRRRFLI
jgi:hypothetical protein